MLYPEENSLRVRVLTTKGNRYLVPLQGAEEQSQAPEREDVDAATTQLLALLEEGGRCTRHSLPPQWEHGTWRGGAGVCADLLEGVGPAVQRECQQRTQNRRWMKILSL